MHFSNLQLNHKSTFVDKPLFLFEYLLVAVVCASMFELAKSTF